MLKGISSIVLTLGRNDFNRLKPHIENAENRYIKPLLGLPMYYSLQEFYEADYPQSPSDKEKLQKELLVKVQFATVHLAFFVGFDFLNISFTDAGFQRIETERTKGLFKYQEDSIKAYFSETGLNALDDVLVFLEVNIDSFEEFMNSENFNKLIKSFPTPIGRIDFISFTVANNISLKFFWNRYRYPVLLKLYF